VLRLIGNGEELLLSLRVKSSIVRHCRGLRLIGFLALPGCAWIVGFQDREVGGTSGDADATADGFDAKPPSDAKPDTSVDADALGPDVDASEPPSPADGPEDAQPADALPEASNDLDAPAVPDASNDLDTPADSIPDRSEDVGTRRSWTEVTASVAPTPRFGYGLAYDETRDIVVLFGGRNATEALFDTWEWNGTTWTPKTPFRAPSARFQVAMAYDRKRQRVLLTGGAFTGVTPTENDTWEYDGTDWTPLAPAHSPPQRDGAGLACDSAAGICILFGGDRSLLRNDTWAWDGVDWTEQFPAARPGARKLFGYVFDEQRGVTVLFGGYDGSPALNDTWQYRSGDTWTHRGSLGPDGRYAPASAYNRLEGRTILFGGIGNVANYLDDSWAWDGVAWTKLDEPGPSARARASLACMKDGRCLLFGGISNDGAGDAKTTKILGDTWQYVGRLPANGDM
jgi:hypothetical protein